MKNNPFWVLVVVFLVIFILIVFHVQGINGPFYWKWFWQRANSTGYIFMTMATIPFYIGQFLYYKKHKTQEGLLLLVSSGFLLQLIYTYIQSHNGIYGRLSDIVMSPVASSYFSAAESIGDLNGFFANFSESLSQFPLHAKNKPFGIILFYYGVQQLFYNPADAAFFAALFIMLISQVGILLVYRIAREIFPNYSKNYAWNSASYFTFLPAFIVITPAFDQLYPLLTCLLILYWNRTLKTDRYLPLIQFTIVLLIITFFTWNILVVGLFLFLMCFWAIETYEIQNPILKITKYTGVVALIVVGFYLFFGKLTGYNIIEVFLTSLENQKLLEAQLNRPWKITMLYDIYDFFLGSAYLNGLLILLVFFHYEDFRDGLFLVVAGVILFAVVAVTYLLPAETARVWIFMQPISVLISVIYLRKWQIWQIQFLFVFELLVLIAISQNMIFIQA